MEPFAQSLMTVRSIPESRIKTLWGSTNCLVDELEYTKDKLIRRAGIAIAEKLAEFNKFSIRASFGGLVEVRHEIEIIVPPGVPNPWITNTR